MRRCGDAAMRPASALIADDVHAMALPPPIATVHASARGASRDAPTDRDDRHEHEHSDDGRTSALAMHPRR
jgi:hypothetical protein